METLDIIDCLRQVPLFSRLSPSSLERVAEIVHERVYGRHAYLYTAGQPGRALYIVVSGEAIIRGIRPGGRARPVGYLRAGDSVGVTSLLVGEPHDATVEAMTDVHALVLDGVSFAQLRQADPDLEEQLELPEELTPKLHREKVPWLDDDEILTYLGRRHWFALAKRLLLPTAIILILGTLTTSVLLGLQWKWYIAAGFWLVLYLIALVWVIIDWRNDYLAVTTERVVHRELILFTYEARLEAPLDRIQDVLVRRGRIGALLGFGDLVVQTAAKSGIEQVVFTDLVDPDTASQAVFLEMHRVRARAEIRATESVRHELRRRLGWATAAEAATEGAQPQPAPTQPPQEHSHWRILPPLRTQEGTRVTWRKHWFFLLRRIWAPLLAVLLWGVILTGYLSSVISGALIAGTGALFGFLVTGIAAGFWLWWQIVDWENDIYILTDDRIIDIEKRPLLGPEDRREASLDRIQNVNLVVPGVLANLLRFGNVDIDTAGGEGQFTFTGVMAPHEVQREIMTRVARYREREEENEARRRRSEIGQWFVIYEGLRRDKTPTGPSAPSPGPAATAT